MRVCHLRSIQVPWSSFLLIVVEFNQILVLYEFTFIKCSVDSMNTIYVYIQICYMVIWKIDWLYHHPVCLSSHVLYTRDENHRATISVCVWRRNIYIVCRMEIWVDQLMALQLLGTSWNIVYLVYLHTIVVGYITVAKCRGVFLVTPYFGVILCANNSYSAFYIRVTFLFIHRGLSYIAFKCNIQLSMPCR